MVTAELAAEWKDAQEQMRAWKEKEMELRLQICEQVFDPDACVEQTFKLTVDGINLKIVAKTNISIDKDQLDEAWDNLTEAEQECFDFKPSLVKKNLDKLDPGSVVFDMLIKKPATPTVSC